MAFDPPPDAPRPPRIIVPGHETAGDPPGAGIATSRIVLPPGVSVDDADAPPEFPTLRPLEIMPVREGDRDLIVVSDPLGVMPGPVALRIEALELMRMLDGSVSITDLATEVVRSSKDLRAAGYVRDFVAQLDRMLMLDSPRFDAAYAEVRDAYHRLEIRQSILGGLAYPGDPEDLERFLGAHTAEAEQMRASAGDPVAAPHALPRALLAPHLDPRRAGPLIARTFLELGTEQEAPLRIVVFGVGHSLFGDMVALTRKHFETPFGKAECDTAFVDAIAARLGDAAYRSELAHRDEHSIEFQVLYLKRRLGRPFRLVPVLCGGFHALLDDGRTPRADVTFETLIEAVRETERLQPAPTVYVAGVDLSHVGTRFGDPAVDDRVLAEVEAKDRLAIEAARRGDADAWFGSIAERQDETRICGWAATYAMLRCAEPGEGRLLRYEQSREADGSMVSTAGMVWP